MSLRLVTPPADPVPATSQAPTTQSVRALLGSWKLWVVLGVLAALVAMFIVGFGLDPKYVPSPLIGKPAPTFSAARINGSGQLNLAEFKGTPVILNFWASWCVACRDEASVLQAAYLKHEQQEHRVRVIGIAIQDTPDHALAFAKRFGKTYPLALDGAAGDIALNYGLYGVPETFFIDANGTIVFKQVGAVTPETIIEQVRKLAPTSNVEQTLPISHSKAAS